MKFIELKKVIGDTRTYRLCISNNTDAHRFVEKYLRSEHKFTGEIGSSWRDILGAIANDDALYTDGNKLIISEFVDQDFYNDLNVVWLESDGYKLLIHLGYESLN